MTTQWQVSTNCEDARDRENLEKEYEAGDDEAKLPNTGHSISPCAPNHPGGLFE
jgi:hypothetical protein